MEALQIIGFAASLVIGISLGLLGGGGSILTVPILVYLLGVSSSDQATAYSLFVVGLTALVGSYQKFKEGYVDFKTFLVFGIPSILSVYATRTYLVPAIPDVMYLGDFELSKRLLVMGLFAVLMVLASLSMIRGRKDHGEEGPVVYNYPLIGVQGLFEGLLTGMVGAGGGFLIIPALVKLSKLSMKKAVGTSLLLIATKSLIGFSSDASRLSIDWSLLLTVASLAVVGIFIGNALSRKVSGQKLKTGFGWFVLAMGVYILGKELWL